MIRIAQPIIGPEEEQAVLEALRSGRLVQGPRVAAFEDAFARYTGAQHAVAVSSGTSALVLSLLAHGIGAGDEVLVPTFTYAATGNAVMLAGAKPILVDITSSTYAVDPAAAEAAITPNTRAIIPVHLFGHAADMTTIRNFAAHHNLDVIEDACQALGAEWQGERVGATGDACFSFYATKAITTGEGGMVTTDDGDVAQTLRRLRDQGESERYVTELLSANHRMTEMAAALGNAQLAKLDAWNETRRRNALWLTGHLDGVQTPVELPAARHVYQQYTIRVDAGRREALRAALADEQIEAVPYYERCLHQQPLYHQRGIGGSFPEAEQAAREVLSLPVHPGLTPEDLHEIATAAGKALALTEARSG